VNAILQIVNLVFNLLSLLILVKILLSYVLSPYHPVRQAIDRIIEPMLAPIRKIIPPVGMFDFSPLILIVLLQIVEIIFTNLVYYLS